MWDTKRKKGDRGMGLGAVKGNTGKFSYHWALGMSWAKNPWTFSNLGPVLLMYLCQVSKYSVFSVVGGFVGDSVWVFFILISKRCSCVLQACNTELLDKSQNNNKMDSHQSNKGVSVMTLHAMLVPAWWSQVLSWRTWEFCCSWMQVCPYEENEIFCFSWMQVYGMFCKKMKFCWLFLNSSLIHLFKRPTSFPECKFVTHCFEDDEYFLPSWMQSLS